MSTLRALGLCALLPIALAACVSAPIQLQDGPGATAVIILPEQLEIATVNGLEIASAGGLLAKGDTTLEVSPGRYEVLAFYRELWERGDHHDMLRSDPALFVVDAEAGGRYRLDYARPATAAEARELADNFQGWVENLETGARTPSLDSGLQFRRGLIPAATFDSTLVPSAASGGSRQRVAPLAQPADAAEATAVAAAQRVAATPAEASLPASQSIEAPVVPLDDGDWLALMKGWWNEANAEERREFLRWVGERR